MKSPSRRRLIPTDRLCPDTQWVLTYLDPCVSGRRTLRTHKTLEEAFRASPLSHRRWLLNQLIFFFSSRTPVVRRAFWGVHTVKTNWESCKIFLALAQCVEKDPVTPV